MKQHKLSSLVMLIMLVVTACRAESSPPPTEDLITEAPFTAEPTEEASAQPTPTEELTTEEPTPEATMSLDDFTAQLVNAWNPATRDLEAIQGMMADPFFVAGPDALIYGPLLPADAVSQLAADGVLTASPALPSDWFPTSDSIAIELDLGIDPYTLYPDAVRYVWVKASDDGQFNVLLGIGEMEDSYRLINMLLIPIVTYTVAPEVLLDLDLYTQTFIEAVNEGEAIKGFVPEAGVWVSDATGDQLFLGTGDEVIAFLYNTWGGGGAFGQTLSAVSTYDDVVALMGNPYDPFPEGQQFIVIDRPDDLPSVVAVIQGGPEQGGFIWTHIFTP